MKNIFIGIYQITLSVLGYFIRSKAFLQERSFISRSKKERLIRGGTFCFLKVRDLHLTQKEYKEVFFLQKQLATKLHTIQQKREADGVCVSQKYEQKPIGFQPKSIRYENFD